MINLVAPKAYKAVWLAIFFSAIPIGYALGFVVAGGVIGHDLFGEIWSWRSVFIFEAVVMIPFIFVVFRMEGPGSMKELDPERTASHESGLKEFVQNILDLSKNRIWLLSSLGYAAQTFLLGGFSWVLLFFFNW
jgi:MFS family permease